VKSRKEVACVYAQRVFRPSVEHQALEVPDVTRQVARRHGQRIAPGDDGARPECTAEEVERLAQGMAGLLRVVLRPEQRLDAVSAMEPPRRGDGEVAEERTAPGLSEHRVERLARGRPQIQRSERLQLEHGGSAGKRHTPG
jgi:hypothetical protein